ncbi:PREDICTED: borealin-like [Priapulus caudatus]|uniref:Borealin-like n=1 Tax=Priapulus caudatus TaxID=37621 RepID=A0ABM1ECH4_PRICU|nr:PREDICTED: borealin-like [Priapulus caudatus]
MPRKRRMGVKRAQSKPKLPEGDEGQNLSVEERTEKLQLFLHDYDVRLERIIKEMEAECARLLKHTETLGKLQIFKLPKHIRAMTRLKFLEMGGTVEAVQAQYIDAEVEGPETNAEMTLDKIQEDCEVEQKRPTRTSKKKARSTKKNTNKENDIMPPPTAATAQRPRRNIRNKFQTPLHNSQASVRNWNTPLITPKFDPRLPKTPALRRPRQGEMLVSMSGSPVASTNPDTFTKPEVYIPLHGRAEVLQLTSDMEVNTENMPAIDDDTRNHIVMLQDKIKQLLQLPNP